MFRYFSNFCVLQVFILLYVKHDVFIFSHKVRDR